ncbi:nucleoside triphosphate pyrophosphohydrolase [bacterium]|nr:MAG: nucleoside triphosphate pyrophosphohydrolase [bacterium]QQR61677.1 MAG: nucleoside triphosphate pyrophosphohydrolase [bacterium]QQR62755.1 MAG: nucleoside triphosphate pyrophosphohydrolase [bacterium]
MEKRRFQVNKLVRDGLSDHFRNAGLTIYTRVMDEKEYNNRLKDKLLEEAGEVCDSLTAKEVFSELADLYEVMKAFAELHNFSMEDVEKEAHRKQQERGNFSKRLYGCYVEIDSTSPVVEYYVARPEEYPEIDEKAYAKLMKDRSNV